jgi:hypothetical protein
MTKKECKKYGLLPPKIAESNLGHGMCGSGGSIYNKDTSQKYSLLALTTIDPEIHHRMV